MSHNVADVVVVIDVLHDDLGLPLLLLNSEFLCGIFRFFEGVFEVPGARFLWPPPHAAVRQDPVGVFVAHERCSGDDDRDNDHETNDTSKHA